MAQVTSSDDVLQEVIVTAEFRQERLQDTPIAITALTSEMLEQKGLADLAAAGSVAPNVSLTRASSGGVFGQMASIFIRGVGQADPHFAVEPGVGVYVDDVYYGVTPGNLFQLLDTNRVEVLRGPQGTLAGKNSIGGAVKLYSTPAGPEPNAYVEASGGSFDRIGGRAASSFTLVDDRLFARVAIAAMRSDGYMDRLDYACVTGTAATVKTGPGCLLGTQGGQNTLTGRVELRFRNGERIENVFIADIDEDNSQNPATKQLETSPLWAGTNNYLTCSNCYSNYETYVSRPVSGPSAGVTFSVPDTTPLDAWGVSNNLIISLTDQMRLQAITAERQSTVTFSAPSDATPASINDQAWRLAHRQFTQELRLTGEVGELLEYTAGAFYYDARGTSSGRVNIPFGLSPGGGDLGLGIANDILFSDPVRTKNKSVFVHTAWHPVGRLGITADVRYSKDSKLFIFNRWNSLNLPNPQIPGLIDFGVDFSGNRTDYRGGLDFKVSDNILAYAQLSTGYKGGGVNPRPFFTSQARSYDPETLTAYEVGVKSQFLNRRATVNVAAFYDRYKDFQGTLSSCDAFSPFPGAPCAMTANVGDAHISGAEIESQLNVGGLSLDAALGWLDFEYTSVNPATGINLNDTNVFTPEFTAAAGVQYAVQLGTLGSITPRLDYTYRSEVFANYLNDASNRVQPFGLFNARINWQSESKHWSATLAVTNLTDKFYYESTFAVDAPPPAPQLFGAHLGRVGRPREFVLTIRRDLGT